MTPSSKHKQMSRRAFIERTSRAAVGASVAAGGLAGISTAMATAELDKSAIVFRRLGRTNFKMSHIAAAWDWNEFLIPEAVRLGVNYLHKINWLPRVPEPFKHLDREAWYCDATIDTFDEQGIIDQFEHARKTLGLEYIDAMKLHSIYKSVADVRAKTGVFAAFEKLKKQGKVRHLACAQHGKDSAAICATCIETGMFDHLQPAMSILPTPEQLKMLELAKKHDVGVITKKSMGAINRAKREARFRRKLDSAKGPDGKAGAAVIKTMLKLPGVTAVTPLTQNFDQLNDNLTNGGVQLTRREEKVVEAVKVACADMCVYCGECHHACPQRIPISNVLRYAAYSALYGEPRRAKALYVRLPAANRASACQGCGSCEKACPLGIPVRAKLREAHVLLA